MQKLSIMIYKFFTKEVLTKIDEAFKKELSMAENKKYVFAQRDTDDYSCIKLTEGKFSDIIYSYTKVQFASEENAEISCL